PHGVVDPAQSRGRLDAVAAGADEPPARDRRADQIRAVLTAVLTGTTIQEAAMPYHPEEVAKLTRPQAMPFRIGKIGHVVLNVSDLDRSVRFYTQVLGFEISDVYGTDMMPGGMVFMRFNPDHHGVALVGSMPGQSPNVELNHMAFEVASLDEVIRARNHLKKCGVTIDFEGRRRAGVQIAVEFRDPDGHRLQIYS